MQLNERQILQLSPDLKKLYDFLQGECDASRKTLRSATDMKQVHRAQAELDMVDRLTTQFFTARTKTTHANTRLKT